ncbi:MAG: hypothetical protein U9Q81_11425 [Pseudomonadota bacterium]|nr:hypothetical protein [Pseudomonadota bacterium]
MRPNLFPQVPRPHEAVWERLSEADRSALLDTLAQLMAKAATDQIQK